MLFHESLELAVQRLDAAGYCGLFPLLASSSKFLEHGVGAVLPLPP